VDALEAEGHTRQIVINGCDSIFRVSDIHNLLKAQCWRPGAIPVQVLSPPVWPTNVSLKLVKPTSVMSDTYVR